MPRFPGFSRIRHGGAAAVTRAGRLLFLAILFAIPPLLTGCAFSPMNRGYSGPPARPESIALYYNKGRSFTGFKTTPLEERSGYSLKQIDIATDYGTAQIEFYDTGRKSDELVFVFPILGGKYWFERYFADYLAHRGIDAAIILRDPEFKKVENIDRIEELFRQGVVRDRITMDFFEKEYGKKQFGSFGISRGGINVAMTAGVDERLKYNIIVMGGTDLVNLMHDSSQNGVKKYRRKVEALKNIDEKQFFEYLRSTVRTEPKTLASYIDARNTLMFVTAFDRTVPFKYQMRLRRQIGEPRTIYLAADHYLSLLYTQFVPMLLPKRNLCLFPFDFIESQSLSFYRKSFELPGFNWRDVPYAVMTLPATVFGELRCLASRECREGPRSGRALPRDGLMYVETRPESPKGVTVVRLQEKAPTGTNEAKLNNE